MNVIEQVSGTYRDMLSIHQAVESACKRIAPTWPLDQHIAVNPYWGFVEDTIDSAALRIESYSGSRMVMPRSYYREQWQAGSLRMEHLEEALHRSILNIDLSDLLIALENDPPPVPHVPLATLTADSQRNLLHGMSIEKFVTHDVSQHCAAYFDQCQATWKAQQDSGLYGSWLDRVRNDMSPWLLMGMHNVGCHAEMLSRDPLRMIAEALHVLAIPPDEWEHYLTALLMSVNGWASWCAYERWQATLAHKEDDHIIQLLAIRLAWDHFVFVHLFDLPMGDAWVKAWDDIRAWRASSDNVRSVDWILQDAHEISYQRTLCHSLMATPRMAASSLPEAPAVQAVFCIDVRSEVFRRALEACSDSIQTLGFAGFFGLPISYSALGTLVQRPQLPGLLAPRLCVTDGTGSRSKDRKLSITRRRNIFLRSIWKEFSSSATSAFTFVEACGLFFAGSLIRRALPGPYPGSSVLCKAGDHRESLRPCIVPEKGQASSTLDGLCDLVAGVLRNMSLTTKFARLILLVGHCSKSTNNPHASGLNCGACGGQSGEVNARVLAGLVNDQAIRAGLLERGISIPSTTHCLAAVHNTTTDEVTIFDTDLVPQTHAADLVELKGWLDQAGHRARCERMSSVGIRERKAASAKSLLRRFQRRARSWSQVRPEWGLANNAAFIIGPRARSRGINLHGRVFLHEYQSSLDPSGTVLEAIMTAPMLVTNWINMQYYASTVDNRLYGSGNKLLHNVVGGRLGVFEGNGGDLRIGLPIQSLHDGKRLRHTPLRLSVFVEAPQTAIDHILASHEVVNHLIHHGWIHLFQLVPGRDSILQYRDGRWIPVHEGAFEEGRLVRGISEESYA